MNIKNRKKSKKIKSKKTSNKKKKIKVAKKSLRIFGTIILSLILVVIITGSILATALTVYVMNFMDNSSLVSLDNLDLSYSSIFYAKDKDGNDVPIYTMAGEKKCIWVDIEKVPQIVQDTFVFAEDARFYSHEGVDFKRTFAAFSNYLLHFYQNEQGGSSITQQLIKNITGDDDRKATRKIREIFSSLNMERNYTKTDILEAYMNQINFGGNIHGIQTAANFYFDKDVSELSVAQAACIVAITKSPWENDPTRNEKTLKNNKERQEYILGQMYKYGAISSEEYDSAMNEELKFVGYNKLDEEGNNTNTGITSYFIDAAINDVVEELMDVYGIDYTEAEKKLKNGGYRIYTTVDMDIQKQLEDKYKDQKTFTNKTLEDPPQSSFITMDYKGNVVGVVGGIGEKKESRGLNRATETTRSPGSCIKPLASYGPAIEYNIINWSTMLTDEPLQVYDPETGIKGDFMVENEDGVEEKWPKNYSNTYTYKDNFVYYYLMKSINSAAAEIVERVTPEASYNFLKDRFNITSLDPNQDMKRSPMTICGMRNGISLQELVASYQAFGNLGSYYEPTYFTRITDANGKLISGHKYIEEHPLSSDTAYVMNRLMHNVTHMTGGTGVAASSGLKCDVVGKTGTSTDWNDLLFVGCTPEYVSGVWFGYDTPKSIKDMYFSSAQVWNNVFKDIANTETKLTFDVDPDVEELTYCTETGLLAGPNCTHTAVGYYKKSNEPPMCTGDHSTTTP